MSLETFLSASKTTVKDNSPSILAALAAGGVVTTALMAHKAGYNYGRDVQYREDQSEPPMTGKEKFEEYWKSHAPTFILAATTITCIIAGTAINNRRNAILGGTLAITETAYREYRDKVEKVVTKPKREQIDKELAQDKLDKADSSEVIFIGDGDILMFDTLTSRTFKSSKLAVQKAEVEIGRRLLSEMYISQNEWYDELGLPRVSMGDDVGWNHDSPLEVEFVPLEKDDKAVLGLKYRFHPKIGYDRFG
ncbi:hypothetical protein SEA_DIZZYRUDY_37 [Microbacterium phage DizzyRudy]|nr:hypothetical protein SEA_DIZZYRUDY_37 [Microbacterium phage DizzyRudy]